LAAHLIGDIATRDGSHPPALQELEADVDQTIEVDAVGLPTCLENQLEASSSATAKKVCGDALIGSGSAEVEVAFPEQKPFRSTGPLLLFNTASCPTGSWATKGNLLFSDHTRLGFTQVFTRTPAG
jgi:hypothetical protein